MAVCTKLRENSRFAEAIFLDRPQKIGQTHRRFYERLGFENWQLRKRLRTAEEIEREDRHTANTVRP